MTAFAARREATDHQSQAKELTLTLIQASVVLFRRGSDGRRDRRDAGRHSRPPSAAPMPRWSRLDQRVRAFPPESRSSMFQARVTRVARRGARRRGRASPRLARAEGSARYVMEIVTEPVDASRCRTRRSSRRRQARRLRPRAEGSMCPRDRAGSGRTVHPGSERLEGGRSGRDVRSFFIDAEYKLKGS